MASFSPDVMSLLLGGIGGFAVGGALCYAAFAGAGAKLDETTAQLMAARDKLEALEKELQQNLHKNAGLEAERRLQQEQMRQHRDDLDAMEKKFALQFENLANRIFDEKSQKFKQDSAENLNQLLNPLRERLQDFHRKVEDSFGQQAKETFSLKEQIQQIASVNKEISLQAESLTRALKGDVKAQGNWGEMMLEKLLEDSGLRRDREYTLQGAEMGLKHVESGRALKPDVIVNLPDNKHIIIDAKVSLTHYERFCGAEDDALRAGALKDFMASIRQHVTGLEGRRYQHTEKLGTPDFVLMFMPIEGAYSLAVQQDPQMHSHAWERGVIVVSPVSLFATLRTIASVWNVERQNKSTLEIARVGGTLVDKVAGFIDYMEEVGRRLDKAQEAYQGASKALTSGRGNILKTAEKLRDLGVKSAKALPASSDDDEDETPADDAALPLKVIEKA